MINKNHKINSKYYYEVKKLVKKLRRKNISNQTQLFLKETEFRPIAYVRYSEFTAIDKLLGEFKSEKKILDIGSPQWYTILKAIQNPDVRFTYINLLENEISPFKEICKLLKIKNLTYEIEDVRNLNFKNNSFDLAYSISVLEHISPEKGGDLMAINEIKRVLKKESPLLITIPFKSKYNVIFSRLKAYEIEKNDESFFARAI